eukprot:gene14429-30793_t
MAATEGSVGKVTLEELAQYTGKGGSRILMSINRTVYDVTSGASFYGPEGGYAMFAGHDCTKCLSIMDLKPENLNDLDFKPSDDTEAKTLKDWEEKLGKKYPAVGTVVGDAGATKKKGECPWPFIWLHDPMRALEAKHATKNLMAAVAFAGLFYYMA